MNYTDALIKEYVLMVEDYNTIAKNIKDSVDEYNGSEKLANGEFIENQNCLLATLAFEMQMRGEDFLPRPVFSPSDKIFTDFVNANDYIVKNPEVKHIKSREAVEQDIVDAGDGARFYIHVNWLDSKGGHEFVLLNDDNKVYVVDPQAGKVIPFNSIHADEYLSEDSINYDNSFYYRIDNKEINNKIIRLNDIKYLKHFSDEDYTLIRDGSNYDEELYGTYNRGKSLLENKRTNSPLYFLSEKDLDGKVIEPRVPNNFLVKNNYEDSTTPRVCFSTSIAGCLRGLSQNLEGKSFYVYNPMGDYQVYSPTVKEVPDVKITKEKWILSPVKLTCVGKIKVSNAIENGGYNYTYGEGNVATLYDWSYNWTERLDEINHK